MLGPVGKQSLVKICFEVQVMAEAADGCALTVIQHCQSPRLMPLLCSAICKREINLCLSDTIEAKSKTMYSHSPGRVEFDGDSKGHV